MENQRWQDWVTALAGAWVFLSPWIVATMAPDALGSVAIWNHYVIGLAIIVLALAALFAFRVWEEWIAAVLGAWLIASPWLFGFSSSLPFTVSDVLVGAIVVLLSGWQAFHEPLHQ